MRLGDFEITEPLPQLKTPHALAVLKPWIDVGNVGSLGLARMERHLHATELGRLARPGRFYDFTRYRPRMRVVNGERVFTTPNCIVHHAHDHYLRLVRRHLAVFIALDDRCRLLQ